MPRGSFHHGCPNRTQWDSPRLYTLIIRKTERPPRTWGAGTQKTKWVTVGKVCSGCFHTWIDPAAFQYEEHKL